jgi:hypothetical protein
MVALVDRSSYPQGEGVRRSARLGEVVVTVGGERVWYTVGGIFA